MNPSERNTVAGAKWGQPGTDIWTDGRTGVTDRSGVLHGADVGGGSGLGHVVQALRPLA